MGLEWSSVACGALGALAVYTAAKVVKSVRANAVSKTEDTTLGLKVVITGGTRGLGLALANKFLQVGDTVTLASRSAATCCEVEAQLRGEYGAARVYTQACDVGDPASVDALAAAAATQMGRIDVWINNAGLSAPEKAPLWESDYATVIACNLLGSMNGSAAAVRTMRAQSPPGGKVFLVDGTGAWGNATPNNAAYGATKRALTQLKDSLSKECAGTSVSVHMFSPGMVATDLLIKPNVDNARSMKFIDILAEEASVVANWLVPRIRGVQGTGSYFKFLTPIGVMGRFITAGRRRGRFSSAVKVD